MERQHLYFTIFILGILIGSSLYLSWSVDRGMGQITVQRLSLEREPGRQVEVLVYQPRDEALGGLLEPTPIILSIHGIAGSKEAMYPFNIELARRNFTVVSIDLPGHGDSTLPFVPTDLDAMAEDAYFALRHVQTNFTNVHDETYGILAHSFGVRIGLELTEYPLVPMAFAAIGDLQQMALSEYPDLPDNMTTTAGFDASIVSETTSWLIKTIQGESQLASTRDPTSQIYFNKTIATYAGTAFILIAAIPLLILVFDSIPERLKLRKRSLETKSFNLMKTFLISSILGVASVVIYALTVTGGIQLENVGLAWPNSLMATGLWLYFTLGAVLLLGLMWILTGAEQTRLSLSSVGIERIPIRTHTLEILKGIAHVIIPVVWIISWLALAGLPESMQPYLVLAFLKWPVGIRVANTVIVMILSIPFFIVEASWIRGLLLSIHEWEVYPNLLKVIFAVVSKLGVASVCALLIYYGLTELGLTAGTMVVLGPLLLVILVIQILSTLLVAFSAIMFENTWPAVILSAFILALVVISSLPLI